MAGLMPDFSFFFFPLAFPPTSSHTSFSTFRFDAGASHSWPSASAFVSVHIIFSSRISVVLAGVGQPLYDG